MNEFHFDHLAAWLLNESSCPVCRQELSSAFREELRPDTEKEMIKLRRIQQNLNMLGSTLGDWERKNRRILDERRKKELKDKGEWEEGPGITKLVVPFLIFAAWVVILFVIFA